MRFHEVERSVDAWADFLDAAHGLGVVTLHSSTEYDSFPLFTQMLARLRERRSDIAFRHVVKLGDPHFDEADFDGARLRGRIGEYLDRLGISHIDDVQWMWRRGLDDDAARVGAFRDALPRIAEAAADLKRDGTIGRFLCFPYSPAFADVAVAADGIDGLVVYRNVSETDYDAAIDAAHAAGKPSLVIRPFHAGKAMTEATPAELLAFALDRPGIEAAVLSTSNLDHLHQLVDSLN